MRSKDCKNKNYTSKKKIISIGLILLTVLLGVIGVGIYYMSKPVVINLNDFIAARVEGYDNYGSFELYIDWDAIKEQYGENIIRKKEYIAQGEENSSDDIIGYLKRHTFIDNNFYPPFMSNGDTVDYNIRSSQTLIDQLQCKIIYTEGTYTLDGFSEPKQIDFFDKFTEPYVIFTGPNGYAEAELNIDFYDGMIIYDDGKLTIKITDQGSKGSREFEVYLDGEYYFSSSYSTYEHYDLSNGDTSVLSVGFDLPEHGYVAKENNIEFVVGGRPDFLTDLSKVTKDEIFQCFYDALKDKDLKIDRDDYEYVYYEDGGKWGCKKDYYDGIEINNLYLATPKDKHGDLEPYLFAEFSYTRHYDADYRYVKTYPNFGIVKTDWKYDGIAMFTELYFEDNKLKHHYGYWGIEQYGYGDFYDEGKQHVWSADDFIQMYCNDYDVTQIG